jgi:hypothetical protein
MWEEKPWIGHYGNKGECIYQFGMFEIDQ